MSNGPRLNYMRAVVLVGVLGGCQAASGAEPAATWAAHTKGVTQLAGNDQALLSAGYDGRAVQWELGSRSPVHEIQDRGKVLSFALHSDGLVARFAYPDVWIRRSDGTTVHRFPLRGDELVFSTDGATLLASGIDEGLAAIDVRTGTVLWARQQASEKCALYNTRRALVCVSYDGKTESIDLTTGAIKPLALDFSGHVAADGMWVSPDDTRILVTVSRLSHYDLELWSLSTQKLLWRIEAFNTGVAAWNSDGSAFVTPHSASVESNDLVYDEKAGAFKIKGMHAELALFEAATGQKRGVLGDFPGGVRALIWTKSGGIAVGTNEGVVRAWSPDQVASVGTP